MLTGSYSREDLYDRYTVSMTPLTILSNDINISVTLLVYFSDTFDLISVQSVYH